MKKLTYLFGWLAKKFKNKYLHLGNYTKENKLDRAYGTPSQVQHLFFREF